MSEVNKRVVQIDFDNAKFEKNIKQTMSTLDKFDEKLGFENASKSIDQVKLKFSTLQVAAVTAIANITNQVVNLGITFAKSLSIDNITVGWQKFGQKTMSVATMAAQKIKIAGKELSNYESKMAAINEQLDKLNWFTDETSYNFTDMVDSIGKFTAVGRDLDESVNAMMGIANWAALSGQNASTASRAMYQLSQALGRGYIQLIDWKSIQIANMDTQEFRQTVLDTAVAMGELTKEGQNFITKTGKKFGINEFSESLSGKWFTNDILLKSLEKYSAAVQRIYEISSETGLTATDVMARYSDELDEFGLKAFKAAQEARTFTDAINAVKDAVSTGWLNTAEKIFGGYDESKILWTELANQLYDVFVEGGNFRNEILGLWRDLAGRADIFGKHGTATQGAFWNIYDSVIAVRNLVKETWDSIFSVSVFTGYSDKVADLANKFKLFTKKLQDFTAKIKNSIETSFRLKAILQGLFSVLKIGAQIIMGIRYALDPIVSLAKDIAYYLFDKIASFGLNISRVQGILEKIEKISVKISNILADIVEYIDPRETFDSFLKFLHELYGVISEMNLLERFIDLIKNFIDNLKDAGADVDSFKRMVKGLVSIFLTLSSILFDIVKTFSKFLFPVLEGTINILSRVVSVAAGLIFNILAVIGDAFNEISKWLDGNSSEWGEILNKIFDFIASIPEKLKVLKPILTVISSVIKTLAENFSELINRILTLFGINDSEQGSIDTVIPEVGIKAARRANESNVETNKYLKLLEGLERLISGIIDVLLSIAKLLDSVLYFIGNLLKVAADLINRVAAFLKSGEIDKLLEDVVGWTVIIASITVALVLLYNVFYTIRAILGPLSYLSESISNAVENIGRSMFINALANLFKSIAIMIVALAASVAAIDSVWAANQNGFWAAIGAIGGFIIIITALTTVVVALSMKLNKSTSVISKVSSSLKGETTSTSTGMPATLRSISLFILSIGAALVMMAVALRSLSGVKPEKLLIAFAALSGLLVVVTASLAIIIAMSKTDKKKLDPKVLNSETSQFKQIARSMSGLGVALMLMSFAISNLANIKDTGKMWAAFGMISMLLALMIGLVTIILIFGKDSSTKLTKTTSTMSKTTSNMSTVAKLISKISWLMLSIATSLKIVSTLSWNQIGSSLTVMGSVLIALFGFVALLTLINKKPVDLKAKSSLEVIANVISAMSKLITSVAASVLLLSMINPVKMLISIAGITLILAALMGMIIGITKLSGVKLNATTSKAIATVFKSLSLILLSISAAILIISAINYGKVWSSIGGIVVILAALMGMIIGITQLSGANFGAKTSKAIATVLKALTMIILSIAAAIGIMSLLDPSKVWSSIRALLLIIAAITGFIFAMTKLSESNVNAKKISATLGYLSSMAVLLIAFAMSMKIMSAVPWQTILVASASIAILMGVLAAISMVKDPHKMVEVSKSLIILGGAFLIFSAAMLIMATVPWQVILTAAGSMAALMIALGAVSLFAKPEEMIGISLSLIVLGGALMIFAVAMQSMTTISWSTIAKGGALLAGSLGLLALVALLVKSTGTLGTIIALSAAVLLLGVGMFMASSFLATFASSLGPFAQSIVENAAVIGESLNIIGPMVIDALMNTFKSLFDNLTELLPSIVAFIQEMLHGIVEIINNEAGPLIQAVVSLITKLVQALADNSSQLFTAVFKILQNLLDAISANINDITDKLITIVLKIVKAITKRVPEIIKNLVDLLIVVVNALFDNLGPLVTVLMERLFGFLGLIIPAFIKELIKFTGVLVQGVLLLIATVIKLVIISLGTLAKLFLDLIGGIILIITHTFIGLTNVLYQAMRTILYNIFYVLYELLGNLPTDLYALLGGALKALFGSIIKMVGYLLKDFLGALGLGGVADNIINTGESMIKSAKAGLSSAILQGTNVTDAIITARKNISSVVGQVSGFISEDVNQGIGEITDAMNESVGALTNSTVKSAETAGKAVGEGIQKGVESSVDDAYDAGQSVGDSVIDGYKDQTKTASPSKVMIQMGQYFVDGLVEGIDDNSNDAKKSVFSMMNEAMAGIQSVIDGGIDSDITIKPVMDLSEVASGASSISSLMSNISGGSVSVSGKLAGNVSARMNGKYNSGSENQNDSIVNNAKNTYNATFNVVSNNPEEIANEVNIRLQKMHRNNILAKGGVK